MSRYIRRVFYACLFISVLIFGVILFSENNQELTFHYIIGSSQWKLSSLLFLSLFIGVLLGILAIVPTLIRLKYEKSKLAKLAKVTEKEVNNLRVMPMKDTH